MSQVDPHKLELVTADGISFSIYLASPISRMIALGIDLLLILGVQGVLIVALSRFSLVSMDTAQALIILGSFLLSVLYFMLTELFLSGKTFGKRLLGLRVIDARSRRLTSSQVILRNLFRVLDMLPFFYMLGGVFSLFHPRFQRLGDVVADTLVIRTPPQALPLPEEVTQRKYNSLRSHPLVEGQLLRICSPEELLLLTEAIRRRESLDPSHRVELFSEMSAYFQKRVRFPRELTEGVSDETFLLNLLDSLTRNQREL